MAEELIKLHVYDKETGKYMRTQDPKIDPLETKLQGKTVYVKYPNATTKALPEYKENYQVPYFIDGEWVVKGNYKNKEVFNTKNKNFEYCYEEELGEDQVVIEGLEEDEIKKFKEEYQKWVMTSDFKIVPNPNYDKIKAIQDIDTQISEIEQKYNESLDTPVVYPANGLLYKPKWASDGTYGNLMVGLSTGLVPFPQEIWDATKLRENMREMTGEEFSSLTRFIAAVQGQLFNERKQKIAELEVEKARLQAIPDIEV